VIVTVMQNTWILKISAMCVVLGMLLAVSLKTQQRVRTESGIPSTRYSDLASAYTSTKRESEKLRRQIEDLQNKATKYETELASGSSNASTLNRELQDSKFLAGLIAAQGPGIVVTLRDSPKKVGGTTSASERDLFIIHDSDLRNFVNELNVAGAEAISINDQRIIARSAIRCVGSVINVNNVELASPYEAKAIGDPKTLESALRMPGGIVDAFPDSRMVDIKQEQRIVVKPYTGSTRFNWAKPVEE